MTALTNMIIGIGNDLIDIRRIGNTLANYGQRFTERLFTPAERAQAESRANPIATYAKRFAAKEACSKALGTGLNESVFFHDMEVSNLPSGQPTLVLTGGALERLLSLMPPNHEAFIHLSLSDDEPYAQAFVIIEALPLPSTP